MNDDAKAIDEVMSILGANQLEQRVKDYAKNPKKAMQLKLILALLEGARIEELNRFAEWSNPYDVQDGVKERLAELQSNNREK